MDREISRAEWASDCALESSRPQLQIANARVRYECEKRSRVEREGAPEEEKRVSTTSIGCALISSRVSSVFVHLYRLELAPYSWSGLAEADTVPKENDIQYCTSK